MAFPVENAKIVSLEPGRTLGVYEVVALIGQGGMGEVYQARDTKLDRDVALKVLPEAFTSDPDRLARFEREAKVLASLNHPNIGTIYGLEEAEGVKALVLELVEGPTLADRIKQGPISLDEALPIAKQIAEALEAAHEQGVIHRDLKPANVKVKPDGTVKVLDFGLAKAFQPDASDPNMSMSPTISLTAAATQMGMVIGTAAYMAPEQAKGKVVDKRADVWAFGAVLYEMLTGRKMFEAADVSEMLASVLLKDPDISGIGSHVPARIRSLLRRCLVKDPKDRLRDIGEARIGIDDAAIAPAVEEPARSVEPQAAGWRQALPLAVGASVVVGLLAGLTGWILRPAPAASSGLARFGILTPDTAPFALSFDAPDVAISADGRQVVYYGRSAVGQSQLFLRPMEQLVGATLRGTEAGYAPFFSPDGEWVGFAGVGGVVLRRVSIFGGTSVTICTSPAGIRGASWGADDQIVFGTGATGLFTVPGSGGEPEVLTTLDDDPGAFAHRWPAFIPGTRDVLFESATASSVGQLAVVSLDTGEVTKLGLAGSSPQYASTGHLVYAAGDGSIRAVPFDVTRLEVTGSPVPLIEDVASKVSGAANFSLAENGSLVYVTGTGGIENTLVWVDRSGREESLPGVEPADYRWLNMSSDGTRLATDFGGAQRDVQVYDIARGTFTRVTTDPAVDQNPLWSLDGGRIVFMSLRDGQPELFEKSADGTGETKKLLAREPGSLGIQPEGWSPDGASLLFSDVRTGTSGGLDGDVSILSLEGEAVPDVLIDTGFLEAAPTISPDGRWIAYHSNFSNQWEIYVQRFPELGDRMRVSTGGGRMPLWSPDGTELFYLSPDGRQVLSVPVATEPTFTAGDPEVLFEGTYLASTGAIRPYQLARDREGFVMIKPAGAQGAGDASAEITVVLNWTQELLERVPIN